MFVSLFVQSVMYSFIRLLKYFFFRYLPVFFATKKNT